MSANNCRCAEQFRLFLDFFQRCPVGIFQDLKPVIAEPCAKLFRPQDERHPVVIRRNGGVGRGGQHREPAALRVRLPQAGHRKQRFAGLDEADAFFKKIRQRGSGSGFAGAV